MKVLAVNASPRKHANTGYLLQAMVDRAAERGCDADLVQLADLDFRGCRSCLVCKRAAEPFRSDPLCVVKDGLRPVLEAARAADVLLFGSPVYFSTLTAEAWAFLHRYWFAAFNYDVDDMCKVAPSTPCGLVFTMNVPDASGYAPLINEIRTRQEAIGGPCRVLCGTDTCQVDDYAPYRMPMFDVAHKKARRYTPDADAVVRARGMVDELISLASIE